MDLVDGRPRLSYVLLSEYPEDVQAEPVQVHSLWSLPML